MARMAAMLAHALEFFNTVRKGKRSRICLISLLLFEAAIA